MRSLYVGNLDPECTEAHLYQKFSPLGNLLSIRLCKDSKTGKSLGYAFVNYASETDAEAAMKTLNHSLLKGRCIRIMRAEKNIKALPPDANVFVKNLHLKIDERTLHDIFANYGNILSLKLATDEKGASKGYAFVQYDNDASANEAIKQVHEKMVRGKIVHVTKFIPRSKRTALFNQYQNIYLKNFSSDLKDKDLIAMCTKFGEILSAKVMTDTEGKSKCFGFVCFRNPNSAKEAVKELNGKIIDGQRIFVDRAKKKDERQKEIMENLKKRFGNDLQH